MPCLTTPRPRALRSPLPGDLLLTAVVQAVVTLTYFIPDGLPWGTGRFLLETTSVLPLIWRRRYPITVSVFCGMITLWVTATVHPSQVMPYSVLICVYTIGSELRGHTRAVLTVLFLIGDFVAEVLHRQLVHGRDFVMTYLTTFAALLLGVLMQTQRAYARAMEERAEEMERSRAIEMERAAAAERARIARDMHDVVGHAVALMIVQAEAGPLLVRSRPEKAEAAFDAISEVGRDAMAQLRRLLGVLKQGDGAGAARVPQPAIGDIEVLVEQVRRGGLAVTLIQSGEAGALPADAELTAYRVVQEALTNTMKHSGASRAEVHLEWRDGALTITVTDDGRGPSAGVAGGGDAEKGPDARVAESGHGLLGLRERLATCDGSLSFRSLPGTSGFALAAYIPAPWGKP